MRRASETDLLPAACWERGVLSLDLATKTGWAHAPASSLPAWPGTRPFAVSGLVPADARPAVEFGTLVCGRPDSSHGIRGAVLDEWLEGMREQHGPALIVIEQPIPAKFSRNLAATQIALGLSMIVQSHCARYDIGFRQVPIVSAKAWFGSKMTRDKKPMLATARALGWAVTTDHEADALAILDLTLANAVNAGRMLRRAA